MNKALGSESGDGRQGPRANMLDELAAKGDLRRYPARRLLIQEGDQGDNIYLVVSGRLRAFSSDNKGKEITLGVYGAGEYVGEMALDGGPRSASVETLEPTVCSVVTREVLRDHIAGHPDFAFDMMARLIRRARLATESARSLALIDVYGRLTRLLDELASERQPDGSRRVPLRLTHQDIANRIVCSREMVSRLLKDLEHGGYLSVLERHLILHRSLPARW